jgi:pilus assembly protein CpaF
MNQWRWNDNGSQNGSSAVAVRSTDELRDWLHQRLVRQLDPAAITDSRGRKSREAVEAAARALLQAEAPEVTGEPKEELISIIVDEIVGFGPIDPLVRDPDVSEIMVNAPDLVYY